MNNDEMVRAEHLREVVGFAERELVGIFLTLLAKDIITDVATINRVKNLIDYLKCYSAD